MAFNPLQQKMHEQHETPASRGVNVGQAADQIAALLDDDGRDPEHRELDQVEEHVRGEDRDDLPGPGRGDDQDLDDVQDDAGDTEDLSEGGDTDGTAQTGDDDQADTQDDAEGGAITTLQELAEVSETPIEDILGGLTHTFTAAGGEVTATLEDLVSGYKLKVDYDRDKTALAETRRSFENEQNAHMQEITQQHNVLAQQFNMVEHVLANRLNDPRLQNLRVENPSEFLIQVREIEDQMNGLRNARQQTAQQYNAYVEQSRAAFMQTEGEKLRTGVSDWNDDKLRASVDTIKSLGYTDDEVVSVVDSRLIKGALELATLRTENAALRARIQKGEKAAGDIKRQVPKGLKPGPATRRTRGPDRQQSSKLRRRLAQTHNVKDAAKVIESMMSDD